jgi:hypothetical protein
MNSRICDVMRSPRGRLPEPDAAHLRCVVLYMLCVRHSKRQQLARNALRSTVALAKAFTVRCACCGVHHEARPGAINRGCSTASAPSSPVVHDQALERTLPVLGEAWNVALRRDWLLQIAVRHGQVRIAPLSQASTVLVSAWSHAQRISMIALVGLMCCQSKRRSSRREQRTQFVIRVYTNTGTCYGSF